MDDASFHSSYGIPIETQLRETQPPALQFRSSHPELLHPHSSFFTFSIWKSTEWFHARRRKRPLSTHHTHASILCVQYLLCSVPSWFPSVSPPRGRSSTWSCSPLLCVLRAPHHADELLSDVIVHISMPACSRIPEREMCQDLHCLYSH